MVEPELIEVVIVLYADEVEVEADTDTYVEVMVDLELLLIMLDLELTDEMVIFVKVEMVELLEVIIATDELEDTVETLTTEFEELDTVEVDLELEVMVDSLFVVADEIEVTDDEL